MSHLTLDPRVLPLLALGLAVCLVALVKRRTGDDVPDRFLGWGFAVLTGTGMVAQALQSGLGQVVSLAGLVPFVVAALRRALLTPASRRSPAAWLFLGVVLWSVVVDLLSTATGVQRAPADVASAALMLAVVLASSRVTVPARWIATSGVLCLTAALVVSAVRDQEWTACHVDKCTALGALLQGPFESENVPAMYGTFTLACVLLGWAGKARLLGSAYCLLLVYYTGSRTSLAVAALAAALAVSDAQTRTAALAAALRQRLGSGPAPTRTSARGRWRRLALVALPTICTLESIKLITTTSRTDLSGRGDVWMRADAALSGHWPLGLGLSRWHELQAVGLLSFHFAHSEYLELVFAGGLVGLGLFTAAQTVLVRTLLARSTGLLAAGPAAVLAVLGLTEVVWNPLTVDGFSWMLVAALLLASVPRPAPAPLDTAPPGVPVPAAVPALSLS